MNSAQIPEKKKRYKVWLKQAGYDLKAAKLSYGNDYHEWACFQAEQAAEKALKAVLVHAGWRPPKMHKLSILVSYCNHANDEFNHTKINFRDLESFTFVSRYPFLVPGNNHPPHEFIQKEDSENCINQAEGIYETVHKILEGVSSTHLEHQEKIKVKVSKEDIVNRLNSASNKLVGAFQPQRILLFGSYARGEQSPGSTIDLLIIANTDMRFFDRIKKAVEVISNGFPPIEPLVYTEEEFSHLSQSEGFFESAMEESILLYEKDKVVNWSLRN